MKNEKFDEHKKGFIETIEECKSRTELLGNVVLFLFHELNAFNRE